MFVRGMADYQNRQPNWKVDNWIVGSAAPAAAQLIPGVSNTTTAAVGVGTAVALGALAYAAYKYFK